MPRYINSQFPSLSEQLQPFGKQRLARLREDNFFWVLSKEPFFLCAVVKDWPEYFRHEQTNVRSQLNFSILKPQFLILHSRFSCRPGRGGATDRTRHFKTGSTISAEFLLDVPDCLTESGPRGFWGCSSSKLWYCKVSESLVTAYDSKRRRISCEPKCYDTRAPESKELTW
jgi:hypothetical protein